MATETMGDVIAQEWIEERFNRKHIDGRIRKEIENSPVIMERLEMGVELVNQWMSQSYYQSKNHRIAQLKSLDITALVMDIFVGTAYSQRPELFTSVTAKMSARLGFSDRVAAITTVAELLSVLAETDVFDIFKKDKKSSLELVSCIELPEELVEFIEHSEFLPPMVCEPLPLTHNHSSGYLTHNDSLVLGPGNHHDGDICLDVLNTMNKVAFKLDVEFLSKVEEEPTFELDDREKVDLWQDFKKKSHYFYKLMVQQGNHFYFNNKVDKRGRIYSCGYHINPQGAPYKKAMLELANEEVVTGVPK